MCVIKIFEYKGVNVCVCVFNASVSLSSSESEGVLRYKHYSSVKMCVSY